MNDLIIREKVDSIITKELWSAQLIAELEKNFGVIIFGGAIRDILFGHENEIRDIDIVLYPIKQEDDSRQDILLKNIIHKNCNKNYTKNQFDGYKIKGTRTILDIWLLKDTWAFRQNIISMSQQNLLKSVYLNIDAYAWDYSMKSFISDCDKKKKHKIDVVLEKSACEELNLIRAVVLSQKYDMHLSDKIIDKLWGMLEHWFSIETDIFSIERRHYGNVIVTRNDIKHAIERS